MYFLPSHKRHLWATKRILYLDSTATQLGLSLVSGDPWQTKEGSFVGGCNGTSFTRPPALSQPNGLFRRRREMCVAFSYLTH